MAEIKTQRNKASVTKFLSSIEDEVRRKDGKALLGLFKAVLKEKPVMVGMVMVATETDTVDMEMAMAMADRAVAMKIQFSEVFVFAKLLLMKT